MVVFLVVGGLYNIGKFMCCIFVIYLWYNWREYIVVYERIVGLVFNLSFLIVKFKKFVSGVVDMGSWIFLIRLIFGFFRRGLIS